MAIARSRLLNDDLEGTYHCISRCVRRAYLCGVDPLSHRDYEHRKVWLSKRIRYLASIFNIDVCGYAIMENHLHVILRNRPDLSRTSSDEDIAMRWWRLFPKRRTLDHQPEEPTEEELDAILSSPERIDELRTRLSSISWFMRCLKENIAKRANAEDECTGRFWEGRFKSIALLDQAAILTCAAYVDLNPIRAGIADKPETSDFTSAQDRIVTRQAEKILEQSDIADRTRIAKEIEDGLNRAKWLCPLQDQGNRRGFLNMTLDDYLSLLDWTGRQVVADKKGVIPSDLAPILTRLDIDAEQWLHSCQHFGSMFYRAAGKVTNMTQTALKAGQKWLRGMKAGKKAFI